MLRRPSSLRKKSRPARTPSLYTPADGCSDGSTRHGVGRCPSESTSDRPGRLRSRSRAKKLSVSGPSLAAIARTLRTPIACSWSSSRSRRGRSPPAAAVAPRCIPPYRLAPMNRYGTPAR